MLTRRSCLLLPIALIPGAAIESGAPAFGATRATLGEWLALLSEAVAARRAGAHLRTHLPVAEAEALVGEADRLLRSLPPSRGVLRAVLAAEFRAGRSVSIGGFLLSRTEAGLLLHAAAQPLDDT
jgi:hypothetical protein